MEIRPNRLNETQFLPGSGHIDTAIWMHYMDSNKMPGEEARRQLHKKQSWTGPGGNTPQYTNCTASCLLSRKLFLEIWGIWRTLSLLLLSRSLKPEEVLPVRVPSMGQIELIYCTGNLLNRYYYYYSIIRAFHISVSRWFFTESSPFSNPLVTVPNAPITIGIIGTCMFHSFSFPSQGRGFLSFFSHSFSFILWSAGTAKSAILQVHFFVDNY